MLDSRISELRACPRGALPKVFRLCVCVVSPSMHYSSMHDSSFHAPYPMSFVVFVCVGGALYPLLCQNELTEFPIAAVSLPHAISETSDRRISGFQVFLEPGSPEAQSTGRDWARSVHSDKTGQDLYGQFRHQF